MLEPAGCGCVAANGNSCGGPTLLLRCCFTCCCIWPPLCRVLSDNRLSGTLPAGLFAQMPALQSLKVHAA